MNLYRFLTDLAAPAIALYLRRRRRKGREDQERFKERLGFASASRPHGKLVWCHAASVGESMSVLSLLASIRRLHPDWSILLTTGTVASAQMMASRLPEGVTHQYVPVDRWPYVLRFLNHWKPDLALWVESELWPNLLAGLKERKVPAILLNGRMSEKSYRRWRLISGGAKEMLGAFALGLAQTGAERNRFAALGLCDVRAIGNLKYAADPLPCDVEELARLKTTLGPRPVWLAASTHSGEEEISFGLHRALRKAFPDLLTIIAPRHPKRAEEIAALASAQGFDVTRRSLNEPIAPETEIYLADTMGEMGLFYRLSKVCFLAGSFTWGGHNPIEPAQLGCAVVFGPKMDNLAVMADDILGAAAAVQVADEAELAEVVGHLIRHPEQAQKLSEAAHRWAEAKRGVLNETLKLLAPFFERSAA
jgi:3-deoxy-D-manno-octulosonic-acid transferase